MNSFRNKLARLEEAAEPTLENRVDSAAMAETLSEKEAKLSQLRALAQSVMNKKPKESSLPSDLDGLAHEEALEDIGQTIQVADEPWFNLEFAKERDLVRSATPQGELLSLTKYLEPNHEHGSVRIASALSASGKIIGRFALDESLSELDVENFLYLDTETTGLAGGTGTIPFLIGLGFFEDGAFVVEQLVVERPGAELPALMRLAERLAKASAIVSFNGKSFDWPLLRTRAVLNRVPLGAPKPHLDLLHASKRIWKRRLGSVRLAFLEEEVLKKRRGWDIPGSEIPARYWQYVRSGKVQEILPVLQHNALDVAALPALLCELATRFASSDQEHHALDRLSVARVSFRANDLEAAAHFADAAKCDLETSDLMVEALSLSSRSFVKRGDANEARLRLVEALSIAHVEQEPILHLALSKLLEHRMKDFAQALHHAERASGAEDLETRDKRMDRLSRKIAKQALPRKV